MVEVTIDPLVFRSVLGHFATGIVVVTATHEGRPYGMAVNSFTSVSLNPPLVAFCAARDSRTWPHLRGAGRFAVNILREDHEDLSRRFGARGAKRFEAGVWGETPSGQPVLDDALAWIDCEIERIVPAGDHEMVLGRVRTLSEASDGGRPLLYYRGAYARLRPGEAS
jgi:3-hydroxy-9,10-secoandrosta-1,3,5(10)-triene-9,17-dione monooxygenase reductase component